MSTLAILSTILPTIGNLLDKWIPDPEQKAKAQLELLKMQQEGDFKELDAQLQIALAQAKINEVEASHTSIFNSGWRPGAGWVCVIGMGYELLLRPLLPWALIVSGVESVPDLPSLDTVMWELVFAMLGLGGMRSMDKRKILSSK